MGSKAISLERAPIDHVLSADGPERRLRIARLSVTARRRIALYPIIFFQSYLALSILVFAFGPWPWPISNPWTLYTFLLAAQIALFAGYRSAIKARPRSASTRLRVPTLVILSLAVNFLWIGQTYKSRTGQNNFDVDSAVGAVNAGLKDPGQQYDSKQRNSNARGERGGSIFDYVTLVLAPILYIAIPLGVFFWGQLSIWTKLALVAWIIVDLSIWVAMGTNKGIADFVLLLPWLLVARNPAMLTRLRPRKVMAIGLIATVGMIGLFTFFSLGLLGRSNGKIAPMYDGAIGISADPDNLALRYLPENVKGPLAAFVSYFVQGYYGLSLCLDQPFIFSYGIGNSYFFQGLSRHLVGEDMSEQIIENTYPARIEGSGWQEYGNWHSLYSWIASDLSFPGTIVFMFIIGRLFAMVWLDAVFCRNLWAVCLLSLVLMMLYYAPANNQVLGFSETALPFCVLLCGWLGSRRGRRRLGGRPLPT